MAAGVQKFSVFDTKHATDLGFKMGGFFLNELPKHRCPHLNPPSVSPLREAKLPHTSSALFDIDVNPSCSYLRPLSFQLGEGDEDFSDESSTVVQHLEALLEHNTASEKQVLRFYFQF